MSRSVQWSRDALDDLKAQVDYIARENPLAARRVADHIRDTATALGAHATGRPGRVSGSYEKLVNRLPYIIVYVLAPDTDAILILRVIHTARDWPSKVRPE